MRTQWDKLWELEPALRPEMFGVGRIGLSNVTIKEAWAIRDALGRDAAMKWLAEQGVWVQFNGVCWSAWTWDDRLGGDRYHTGMVKGTCNMSNRDDLLISACTAVIESRKAVA